MAFFMSMLLHVDDSCQSRQQFFRQTAEGTLALIRNASTSADARAMYTGWCEVESADKQAKGGNRVFFGLNNRSSSERQPRYYIVKIFRRSRATELRPLLSLRRIGDWRASSCPSGPGRDYRFVASGATAVTDFLNEVRTYGGRDAGQVCRPLDYWYANAFGVRHLSIERNAGFLTLLPERVKRTGVGNWSLSVTVFGYGTVGDDDRLAAFPVLSVTRDGADEIIVQYISSGSKYHEFVLAKDA